METINYLISKTISLLEPSCLKVVVSFILSICFFFFGHIYTDALIAIASLMIMDLILGISASVVEGESISSGKFKRSVLKGILYFSSISAGYFADLTVPFNFIQGTMVGFVGVTEFISIIENIGRHGFETPKKLLNNLKDYRDKK